MNQNVKDLCEPCVDYMGVARWPVKLSVSPLKWVKYRPFLVFAWCIAFVTSLGVGYVHQYGTAIASLLVLAALYYWYRVWKRVWYSCLIPAVVISRQPLQIASYANLSQKNTFYPAIKITPTALSVTDSASCDVGTRIVCIGEFEPPIAGFNWVSFQPIPLENLVSSQSLVTSSQNRLPEYLWETLEAGLETIQRPEPGLYELPTDLLSVSDVTSDNEEGYANSTTVAQKVAKRKDLSLHYLLVGCLVLAILGSLVYVRSNPYSAAIQAGDAAYKSGNFAKATEYYEKAIRLDSKSPVAYLHRAVVYQKSGDHRKAQMDFNDLLRLKPDFGPGYRLRAESLKALRLDEAAANDMTMADKLGADSKIIEPFKLVL